MTEKEKAIMTSLNKTIEVEFRANTLPRGDGLSDEEDRHRFASDKQALQEAGVKYDTTINLKMRASARTVIKRLLGDLGLAYYIKEETMQVTSASAPARRPRPGPTTSATWPGQRDIRMPPVISQLQMIENVNRIITLIKSNVDPKSWKDNNPNAPGAIYFDPVTMSLIVKQTAEIHFMLDGK